MAPFPSTNAPLRVLVAVASYGTSNDHYLLRLIEEYRSMPFDIDIVVLSNLNKQPAPDVEVLVGLPDREILGRSLLLTREYLPTGSKSMICSFIPKTTF